MNIATSVAQHERQMAVRWFNWCAELGGTEGHKLFLLPAAGMDASEVVAAAEAAFPGAVTLLVDAEAIKSDWQSTDLARSASGPNSAIRQLAWHFQLNNLGPWLFIEMDCIPLKPGWINALETEYLGCGKPFMGAEVKIPQVPIHLTGNAVYPEQAVSLAPTLVMRTNWTTPEGRTFELAFDVASATEVLPQAHFTKLIQHEFRHKGFKNRAEVDTLIRPDAVLFHSNKSGDLIQILKGENDNDNKRQNSDARASPNTGVDVYSDSTVFDAVPEEIGSIHRPKSDLASTAKPDTEEVKPPWSIRYSQMKEAALQWKTKYESLQEQINGTPVVNDSRASLTRDTVAILRQLCDTPSRKALVQRELKRQKIVR